MYSSGRFSSGHPVDPRTTGILITFFRLVLFSVLALVSWLAWGMGSMALALYAAARIPNRLLAGLCVAGTAMGLLLRLLGPQDAIRGDNLSMAAVQVILVVLAGGLGWTIRHWRFAVGLVTATAGTYLLRLGGMIVSGMIRPVPDDVSLLFWAIPDALLTLIALCAHQVLANAFDAAPTAAPASEARRTRWRDAVSGAILIHVGLAVLLFLKGVVLGASVPVIMSPVGASGPYSHGFRGGLNALESLLILHLMSLGISVLVLTVVGIGVGLVGFPLWRDRMIRRSPTPPNRTR